MPLSKGHSKAVVAKNIREMEASGHSHETAVAAALHMADESKKSEHHHKMAMNQEKKR